MKLLLDENLPPALVGSLRSWFPESLHVHDCGLGAADDTAVWEYAKANGCIIVTKDSDFEQLSVMRGAPPQVIWVRTGNCTTAHLAGLFARHSDTVLRFGESPSDSVLELR